MNEIRVRTEGGRKTETERKENMPLMTNSSTHSGRVRVRHHSWDSGKHRYPQHDALPPAHSWRRTGDAVRTSSLPTIVYQYFLTLKT